MKITDPEVIVILAISHLIVLTLGMFIVALFGAQKIRRAVRDTWRESERLHRERSLQDLRDNTSARIAP